MPHWFDRIPILNILVRTYRRRLTTRGRYLLWVLMVLAVLGLDTRRTQVYLLFSAAAGLFLMASFFSLGRRPRVRMSWSLPGHATAGQALRVFAEATCATRATFCDLQLTFAAPPGAEERVRFHPADSVVLPEKDQPRAASTELRVTRRGRYEMPGLIARWTDPLRLTTSRATNLPAQTLLVYPRYYSMEEFEVPLGRKYQPGGIPLSSSTGDAIEFVGTREYREGDPVKNIHWRSWARRGVPVVKEYQEEYFCRIAIILDTFLPPKPNAGGLAAFEAGISVVASIADYFSRSEYIVDILAAGPDIYEVSSGRSLAYLENILDVLACLEPCADPPFQTIGPPLFEKLAQITTVVAVLQDWDESREMFLRQVKSEGAAVRAMIVRDGATSRPWQHLGEDLGEISALTVEDVSQLLAKSRGEAVRA